MSSEEEKKVAAELQGPFWARLARMKGNATWEELTQGVGLGLHVLTNAKNQRRLPSLPQAIMLADFFEVSVDELLGRPVHRLTPEYRELLENFVNDLRQQLGVTGGNIFENTEK